jgi:hypothetical protein
MIVPFHLKYYIIKDNRGKTVGSASTGATGGETEMVVSMV